MVFGLYFLAGEKSFEDEIILVLFAHSFMGITITTSYGS